ncbi:MAG: transcriptional regulator [Alphaproteobacteria bacterium]|nr:transcriptional regulator [Alphaproteobacteria bacterium]
MQVNVAPIACKTQVIYIGEVTRRNTDPDGFRSGCPLASTLDIVGDRWSLLIVRGLFVGFSRYGDFLAGPEKISTNILAARLKTLECAGLIERLTDEGNPRGRYRLTRKGADLLPAMQALTSWGAEHLPDRWEPPGWFMAAKPSDYYPD